MRKLVLVVVALVLAALVWMFARTLTPSILRAPTAAPNVGTGKGSMLDPLGDDESIAETDSRSALDSPLATVPKIASSSRPGLRVVLRFERGEDHEPEELDVRVLDLLGEEHPGQRERGNAFFFSDLPPATYAIEATEAASMKTVQRVKLDTLGETKVVEITLTPSRSLRVHWVTSDGRPFGKAVLDSSAEPDDLVLEVLASHVPLHQEDSGNSSLVVDSIQVSARARHAFEEDDSSWPQSDGRSGTGEGSLDVASDPADPSLFCTFDIRTSADLWLSAWYRGMLLDSQSIARDQTDVRFTSSLATSSSLLVPVSLRLVDDVTGEPVTTATVYARGRPSQRHGPDAQGRCAFTIEPGRTRIDIEPGYKLIAEGSESGRSFMRDMEIGGGLVEHAWTKSAGVRLNVLARPGEPLDLGDVRVPQRRSLRFRVLDAHMRPVEGANLELIRKRSYDPLTDEHELQRASSNDQGLAVFHTAANEAYVVTCHFIRLGSFDSEPLVVDARAVGDDPAAIAADITLRPLRKVSIVLDPPPRPGARALLETTDGLPVSSQVLDELGLCVIGLGGVRYQLRLVEDGQVRQTIPFTITTDPFVLTVQR